MLRFRELRCMPFRLHLAYTSILVLLMPLFLMAQTTDTLKIDTSYYEKYTRKLIVSPFLVKSVSAFSLSAPGTNDKIKYYTNAPAGIGLRFGFDWLSFFASYGVRAIDPDYSKSKGKTKRLNLQTTFAGRSFLLDVYYQTYKGLYLRADAAPPYINNAFYVRPDAYARLLGFSGMYVFNGRRFTARPPFKYDAWQKKSSGSLMAGFEFFSGLTKGDSALIPAFFSNTQTPSDVNKINFLLFGPSIGYGHSVIIKKHFFITAIGSVNTDVAKVKEYNTLLSEKVKERWCFEPNINLRGGIGYNKPNWEIAFSYFTKRLYFTGENNKAKYLANNNDYRLSFTKRINAGKTIPKVVDWAGNIIEKMGLGFLIK